jgi:hypothetical protein
MVPTYTENINKLAIIVPNLGFSQLSFYVIKALNELLTHQYSISATVFVNEHRPSFAAHLFPIMHTGEAFEWSGTIIATTLSSAYKIIDFPGTKKKFFYVWDLEWLRLNIMDHKFLYHIYHNPRLKLIARSIEHANIIEEAWNVKPTIIIEDFEINSILNIMDEN